jgi:hypothetical protein
MRSHEREHGLVHNPLFKVQLVPGEFNKIIKMRLRAKQCGNTQEGAETLIVGLISSGSLTFKVPILAR